MANDKEKQMRRQYRTAERTLASDTTARYDANGNRILMKLTFEEWKFVWVSSGLWEQKGRTVGSYCMSRKDDIGHYEIGNVFIQLHSQNVIDKNLKFKATHETKQKMSESHKGMPGRKHSEKTKKKMSTSMAGKGHPSPFKGVPASSKSAEKNRQSQLARWAKIKGERSSQTA